jgi:hypothetical protein
MVIDRGKPIRSGVFYCSPSCGANCTWVAYQTAVAAAEKLAATMGVGWEANVWENLGWFYSVSKGVATIHPNINRNLYPNINRNLHERKPHDYTVFFNSAHQIVVSGKAPKAALRSALRQSEEIEQKMAADRVALEGRKR